MNHENTLNEIKHIAGQIDQEIKALVKRTTPAVRAIRRKYTKQLEGFEPNLLLSLARELVHHYGYRGPAYELIRYHKKAFSSVGIADLEALGRGINSWWSVDGFARILAEPLWLRGQIPDEAILRWAGSDDLWWRRAALVSTVALNVRSQGGQGDTPRTLKICRLLVADHEDMVVKGLSWALRELVPHDPTAVMEFLDEHEGVLAARVRREVRNKLETGLKNPKLKG